MWAKKLPVTDDVSSIIINGQFKKFNSAARFRSEDIRVMSPARFHCATALNFYEYFRLNKDSYSKIKNNLHTELC